PEGRRTPHDLVGELVAEGAFAVVGGFDTATCAALSVAAEQHGILYFNVGCADDALRGADCRPGTFHVAPSAAMRADALAASDVKGDSVLSWHPSLVRYGARQVNDRFRTESGREMMTAAAWTAWLAVKVLSEAAMRLP